MNLLTAWRRLWGVVQVLQCHKARVTCPHCGADVTDTYRHAPWFRPLDESMFTTYGYPVGGASVGMQVCHACHRSWTVSTRGKRYE